MTTSLIKWRLLALLIAVVGAFAGLIGSGLQEFLYGGVAVAFVGAPMIEEALKPSGLYLLLAKWPHALAGRIHIALLSALAGITFGLVENALYLKVYFPEHSHGLMLFRFAAGLPLHAAASFIFGLGINRSLIAAMNGEIPFSAVRKRFFIAAMALHASFNIAVTIFVRDMK